jgi:hypothetical protein
VVLTSPQTEVTRGIFSRVGADAKNAREHTLPAHLRTMATVTTLRPALRRQLHISRTSQLVVKPALSYRSLPVQLGLSKWSPNQNVAFNWRQKRHQSDHFRPRAISAFKSKKHYAPDDPIPDASSLEISQSNNDVESNKEQNDGSNQEISDVNQIPEQPNSTSIDSNPWAHMHLHEFAPKIVVIGVGGAGTNAVNNMVSSRLTGEP